MQSISTIGLDIACPRTEEAHGSLCRTAAFSRPRSAVPRLGRLWYMHNRRIGYTGSGF
jgi:hypothetical protein